MRKSKEIEIAFWNEGKEDFYAAKTFFYAFSDRNRISLTRGISRDDDAIKKTGLFFVNGSSFFMLYQMAIEKIVKAFYCHEKANHTFPPKEHDINLFLGFALRNTSLLAFWGRYTDFASFVVELCSAQPSVARSNKENLEYPWKDSHGRVKCPCRDLSLINKYLKQGAALHRNLVSYILATQELIDHFENIFK